MKRRIIFIIKRMLFSVFVLGGLSVVIFVISRIMPGDPARMALGDVAPEEIVQKYRILMFYDKPIHIQYYHWLKAFFHGDWGVSLTTGNPVLEDITQLLPATLEMAIFALILIAVIGITIGVFSARYNNTWIDNLGRFIAYSGAVTPSFVFAIIGMLIFCYTLNVLPAMGRLSPGLAYPPKITGFIIIDSLIQGNFIVLVDAFKHLILPVISLGLLGMSGIARITRASVYRNMKKDYILSIQSYGVPMRVVWSYFLLKPSLLPVVSILGLELGAIVSHSFLIELIFNWPGFARYAMIAILQKDLNVISGVVLVVGMIFILSNIIVDLTVDFLDPRTHLISQRSE